MTMVLMPWCWGLPPSLKPLAREWVPDTPWFCEEGGRTTGCWEASGGISYTSWPPPSSQKLPSGGAAGSHVSMSSLGVSLTAVPASSEEWASQKK